MLVFLMVMTILAVLLLVLLLVKFLSDIIALLRSIGGDGTSYLAKLRLGLRAIETHTSHLPGQVQQLNTSLSKTAEGLQAADQHLQGTIEAVSKQKQS